MAKSHLVILKKPYLAAILAGRKRVESRFTRTRRAFVGRVEPGDTLFLKQSSGPVCVTAQVAAVKNYEGLTPEKIFELKQKYNAEILGDSAYWQSKACCRYGMLVWLRGVRATEPVWIDKKDWRAWVVLDDEKDFGLLSAPWQ